MSRRRPRCPRARRRRRRAPSPARRRAPASQHRRPWRPARPAPARAPRARRRPRPRPPSRAPPPAPRARPARPAPRPAAATLARAAAATSSAGASGSGSTGLLGSGAPASEPPPGSAGRLTRLSTSPTEPDRSSMCGTTCLENSYTPMPSMAAAIITPARLERDSRTSSVCIALPAPSCISSARLSSPASRHAATGSRRKRSRNAGSASSRSISRAARSVSVAATAHDPIRPSRRPLTSGFATTHTAGRKNASHSVPITV